MAKLSHIFKKFYEILTMSAVVFFVFGEGSAQIFCLFLKIGLLILILSVCGLFKAKTITPTAEHPK